MTVQEAIKKNIAECKRRIFRIKDFMENSKDANNDKCKENIFVLETTIQALEEVEQYRALGTVEGLKEAREKQVAKKVIVEDDGDSLLCPSCGLELMGSITDYDHDPYYCFECGQALKWGEEDD